MKYGKEKRSKGNPALNKKKFMHAKQRQKNIHALSLKNSYKGNASEKHSCEFSLRILRPPFSCCSKTCSIASEKRKKLSIYIYWLISIFFFMIPEISFVKMDDTLFNFVVYFSLNKNSVNHWFFTPFMNPDNNRYREAPRTWKEIGSLSNYDADADNLKIQQV